MRSSDKRVPAELRWLFWNDDFSRLDLHRDEDHVIARVLEHGGLTEVRWLLAQYGTQRIRRFFRTVGHPDISDRTRAFWRVILHAGNERWPQPAAWRRDSSALWVD